MPYLEVVAILGEPDQHRSISLGPLGGLGALRSAEAVWKRKRQTVTIRFVNDVVTIKRTEPRA